MPHLFRSIAFGALIAGGFAFASVVYAEQRPSAADQSSMMGGVQSSGMMGMGGGMMGGNDQNGSSDASGGRNGMTGMMAMMNMMARMAPMMDGCSNMMQSHGQPPNSQFHKPSQQPQKD